GDWRLVPDGSLFGALVKGSIRLLRGARRSSVQLALRVHGPAVDELTVGVRNDQLVEAVDDRADVMGDDGHALAHRRSGTVIGQPEKSVVLVQGRESTRVARHPAVAALVVSFAGERFRSRVDDDVFVPLVADDGACDEQTDIGSIAVTDEEVVEVVEDVLARP